MSMTFSIPLMFAGKYAVQIARLHPYFIPFETHGLQNFPDFDPTCVISQSRLLHGIQSHHQRLQLSKSRLVRQDVSRRDLNRSSVFAAHRDVSLTRKPSHWAFTDLRSGKVRELFKLNDSTLLMGVTDRISAYDEVLANGIPDKGEILCQISGWYLEPDIGTDWEHGCPD